MKTFSVLRYWTSNALYSPRGDAHVKLTSVSDTYVELIPVIGSGSGKNRHVYNLFKVKIVNVNPVANILQYM